MMQVSKKIPFDDPQVLLGVRILYIVTNIIIAGGHDILEDTMRTPFEDPAMYEYSYIR